LIKIRYAYLPAGLHVRAEAQGRSTVIYLLPGLTNAERQAALLRARRSAGLGRGPRLPATSVAAAVVRDRVWGTTRNGAAAFWGHPLLFLPPVLLVASATLAYVMLSTVSITFHQPVPGGTGGGAAPHGQQGLPGAGYATRPGATGGTRPGGVPGRSASPSPATSPSPRAPSPGSSSGPSGSGAPSPGLSGSAPPGGGPGSATPPPSPSPSWSTCLNVGPIGICLK
jgi:hypothetical protein